MKVMINKKDKLSQDKEGFVYFITNGYNIKIGYTVKDVKRRLKQLNTGSDQ